MEKQFYKDKEVAERLAIGLSTLRRWRVEGKGPPYHKISGAVRYAENDILAYLSACQKINEQ